jgi:hypothetical protein
MTDIGRNDGTTAHPLDCTSRRFNTSKTGA